MTHAQRADYSKSGTFDTFKALVLGGKALAPGAKRFEDSNALSEAVAGDPNGIGFIGFPYIHSAKALAVSEKGQDFSGETTII
jgi:phosphate transport system substrate-binding protein